MRTAKHHPQQGWLFLEQRDYSRSLDRLLLERDRLNDPTHSGPAPAYLDWVWSEELPALAQQPRYKERFLGRIAELNQQLTNLQISISQGRLDLQGDADGIAAEIQQLEGLL